MSSNLNIGDIDATAMADLIRKREVSSVGIGGRCYLAL